VRRSGAPFDALKGFGVSALSPGGGGITTLLQVVHSEGAGVLVQAARSRAAASRKRVVRLIVFSLDASFTLSSQL
jgi:hypothetical protein